MDQEDRLIAKVILFSSLSCLAVLLWERILGVDLVVIISVCFCGYFIGQCRYQFRSYFSRRRIAHELIQKLPAKQLREIAKSWTKAKDILEEKGVRGRGCDL